MNDKILCFNLNGFTLGVESEQVDKVFINKHPSKESFILETGVEVKSLKTYIPLPEKEGSIPKNILFIKDQKDSYGFTIDNIIGYLKLKASEKIGVSKGKSIKYFIRNRGEIIPVLDLKYITNNVNSVIDKDIEDIVGSSKEFEGQESEEDEVFNEISQEDVFRSIEEEINKGKKLQFTDSIESEKKGFVMPLLLNFAIIALVSVGICYYLFINKEKAEEKTAGGIISGVEEEVIKEVKRRSEEEIKVQKRKLEDAKKRLESLNKEKDYFLENQDKILSEKEETLNKIYQMRLEEIKNKILSTGSANAQKEFEIEKERLYNEFLKSREEARKEIDEVKKDYEDALKLREEEIKKEASGYNKRINEIEQKLTEEKTKLKETEEKFQTIYVKQEEYIDFRKQLNSLYHSAMSNFSNGNYENGIIELNKILPIIDKAKNRGLGDEVSLNVEARLIKNIEYLAEREKNRIDLDQIGQNIFKAATTLEKDGRLDESLQRYFTVYTIVNDRILRKKAFERAEFVMEQIYKNQTEEQIKIMEKKADALFNNAMLYKKEGDYSNALNNLQKIIIEFPKTTKSESTLNEIIAINSLIAIKKAESERNKVNKRAFEVINEAREYFINGNYSKALEKYEKIVEKFNQSDYLEDAIFEIIRINEQIKTSRGVKTVNINEGEIKKGVIIKLLSMNNLLISLGSEDGIKVGENLSIYRKENDSLSIIGSFKISEVYPTISKGKVNYYEKKLKVGDLVSY